MTTQTITDLDVRSSAFEHQAAIPSQYTCDGNDISPPLEWSQGPNGTQCYALIMDDPDAPRGTWVHWLAWNIPTTSLSEDQPQHDNLGTADQGAQGMNSWSKVGYGGPCPPSGTHRYFFKVYALDRKLTLKPSTTKEQLLSAMEGHILAQGELMGTYSRKR